MAYHPLYIGDDDPQDAGGSKLGPAPPTAEPLNFELRYVYTIDEFPSEAQQLALRELNTPLIPLAEGVVVMPLIGHIDSGRAKQLLEVLLEGVTRLRSKTAIVDITGVRVVDTHVASVLLQAARAVRLLGAQVVLTGIGAPVAQALIEQGADLSDIVTHGTLQSGIAHALRQRDVRVR